MNLLGELVGGQGAVDKKKESEAKKDRVTRAQRDFGFFCETYLSDYFFTDAAEYQRILFDVADSQALSPQTINQLKVFVQPKYQDLLQPNETLAGAMFIEPREHGKTVRWSFAYPLWRLLCNKSRYVLLIGAAGATASENLINIRTELEENEALMEDFGDMKGDGRWSDNRIELKNGTCLQAKGSGMSMRGTRYRQYRPDLIILDDILKDDAVDSPTQRSKIHRWLKRVVFNLGKTAFLVWVNTIFHNDDPISRLMEELRRGTLKRWIAVRLSCWKPDDSPLWPENWSREILEEKRTTLGSDVFSTEYENEPLSDEDRIIKEEWIRRNQYTSDERPALNLLRKFNGVDPATGAHDGTAMVSIGVDQVGTIWILDQWSKPCSENETVLQLSTKHKVFQYEQIAWEGVSFQKIYARFVGMLAAQQGVYLPIRTVEAGGDSKATRLRAISPLIENGLIRFRKTGDEELIDQLCQFPKAKFDDLCDALAYAVKIAGSGPSAPFIFQAGKRQSKSILRGF